MGSRGPGNENPTRVSGSWEREPKTGSQEWGTLLQIAENKNWARIPRSWEPVLGSRSQEPGTLFGFSFPGTRNSFWVPFSGTREPIVNWLEMEVKTYFKHSNMLKKVQKRNSKCVPFLRDGTQRNWESWHPYCMCSILPNGQSWTIWAPPPNKTPVHAKFLHVLHGQNAAYTTI
jgi:hypothetical protein